MIKDLHNSLTSFINSNFIFSLDEKKKNEIFNILLNTLTNYHIKYCKAYSMICKKLGYKKKLKFFELDKLPFLPVNIFKNRDLFSVNKKKIIKIMNSSGTSSNLRSRIFLDKENSTNQVLVLKKIFLEITKFKNKVSMLVIDNKKEIINKSYFSARAAAIVGFSKFTSSPCFVINDNNELDLNLIDKFLKKNKKNPFLIFGFTNLIWTYLLKNDQLKKFNFDFSNGTIIHGGGWKKLKKKLNNFQFKNLLNKKFKIPLNRIFNYYGMIEQIGSIFFECESNDYFHVSKFSNIIIRNKSFENVGFNKKGFIQLQSILPTSYPGHNILTEDLGVILGEDDCSCGKKGKYFKVFGRIKKSESRGCSDAIN